MRNARANEPSVLGSSSITRRWALAVTDSPAAFPMSGRLVPVRRSGRRKREIDAERRAKSRLAFHGDCAAVVADHRLDNCEAESGAMLLGGVVRREEPRAFLLRKAASGVGDLHAHGAAVVARADGERAA